MNRINAIQNFVRCITFIIGGILATLLGRSNVFRIEAIIGGLLIIFIIYYMKDIQKKTPLEISKKVSQPHFFDTIKGGIKYLLDNKIKLLFVIGDAVAFFSFQIWGNLLIFPIYFGYSGSDKVAGIVRSIIFFIGVAIAIAISNLTKKVDKKRFNLILALHTFGLFIGLILLLHFIPLKNELSWMGIIIFTLLLTLTNSFIGVFTLTLYQRIFLDFFPSEYRNSLYSFVSTLIGIISVFFLPFTGAQIEKNGLIFGPILCLIFVSIGLIMMEIAMRVMNHKESAIKKTQKNSIIVAD